ncbi:MAG: NADH-quinone oxidoreductase subunit C [Acidobacteria bacterium]|nr:NADH-quinone oxidoreductase subunit C [Acidobacteriota bacterium]
MSSPQELENHAVVRRLKELVPHGVAEILSFRGELTIVVPREHLRQVSEILHGEPELGFRYLSDVTGVDRFPTEPRFELNYHLVSIARKERIRLKVRVGSSNPTVDSVTFVWEGSNWHEREVFDLFGVRFEGHPDLRRILLPETFEGFPLRKDFPVEGFR